MPYLWCLYPGGCGSNRTKGVDVPVMANRVLREPFVGTRGGGVASTQPSSCTDPDCPYLKGSTRGPFDSSRHFSTTPDFRDGREVGGQEIDHAQDIAVCVVTETELQSSKAFTKTGICEETYAPTNANVAPSVQEHEQCCQDREHRRGWVCTPWIRSTRSHSYCIFQTSNCTAHHERS